jgi:hypothetical protein
VCFNSLSRMDRRDNPASEICSIDDAQLQGPLEETKGSAGVCKSAFAA